MRGPAEPTAAPTTPATATTLEVDYGVPMQHRRMVGYVPPCRVIPDPNGSGSIGLHYDENVNCPTE